MSVAYAKRLLAILEQDKDRLEVIKRYLAGDHDDPYMPDNADDEYKLLAERAITNWMPFLVETPVQAMFVDGFRRGDTTTGRSSKDPTATTPEWKHWQDSRLDARQTAIMREAVGYGHSFAVTEKDKRNRVITKGLSPLRTSALYEDPANDDTPVAALTVKSWPAGSGRDAVKGKARLWTERDVSDVTFHTVDGQTKVSLSNTRRHGAQECPVTRFAFNIDLEGNTLGVVEPFKGLNDRLNQTMFDLLVAQSYGSHKVRWVTGMAPPLLMEAFDAEGNKIERPQDNPDAIEGYRPRIDPGTGSPIPAPINHNARRFLFAEDENVKFGAIDGSSLDGYISAVDLAMRHLSALSQTPPHHLLGQIANLSAEALLAAETAFSRKVEMMRTAFGESWERVFRIAGSLSGEASIADNMMGEVIWRDMEARSMSQMADALGKLSEQLQIPKRGLWRRVPGVTEAELLDWEEQYEDEQAELKLAEAVTRATQPLSSRISSQPSRAAQPQAA